MRRVFREPLRGLRRAAALLAIFVFLGTSALAQERILAFDSQVDMADDGSLAVTETIRVRAEGRDIRRGIYRDFPLQFEDAAGRMRTVGFDVRSVTRDGKPEPFRVERNRKVARVYVGDAGVFLAPGVYEYRIAYSTDRQVRFFEDHDELFWNVTGNAWMFPIDRATATITLPQGGRIGDTVSFTGAYGSRDNNAVSSISDDRRSATFATTIFWSSSQSTVTSTRPEPASMAFWMSSR